MSSRVDDLLRKYSANPAGNNYEMRSSRLNSAVNAQDNNRISNYLRPSSNFNQYETTKYTSEIVNRPNSIETFGNTNYVSEFNKPSTDYGIPANTRSSFNRTSYNPPIPAVNTNYTSSNLNVRDHFDTGKYSGIGTSSIPKNDYTSNVVTTTYTKTTTNNLGSTQNLRSSLGNSNPINPTPSYTSTNDIDPFVQQVLQGAEIERLSNLANQHDINLRNRPDYLEENVGNDDSLYHENNRLRETIRDRDFKMKDYSDENERMKEREENLKHKLNELNEENKRLMSLHNNVDKGPWCC